MGKGFDPNQPRVPAGDPSGKGGHWTDKAASAAWRASGVRADEYLSKAYELFENAPIGEEQAPEVFMARAYLDYEEAGAEVKEFLDERGNVVSVISYIVEEDITVLNFGSFGKGFGTKAMQYVINEAAKFDKGIKLIPTLGSEKFYRKFGFEGSGSYWFLSSIQVKELSNR